MNEITARLVRLCEGRPLTWDGAHLKVEHEYSQKGVDIYLDADDLALPDDELVSRIIRPAMLALNMASYPERQARLLEAMRAEMEAVQ